MPKTSTRVGQETNSSALLLPVAASTKVSTIPSLGSFSWPGGYGTTWFADPRRDLVAILATQVWQDHLTDLGPAFERAVCAAVDGAPDEDLQFNKDGRT